MEDESGAAEQNFAGGIDLEAPAGFDAAGAEGIFEKDRKFNCSLKSIFGFASRSQSSTPRKMTLSASRTVA
jgi:hypothetical protein